MTRETQNLNEPKQAVTETTPAIGQRGGLQILADHPWIKFVLAIAGLAILLIVVWNWLESFIEKAVLDAAGSKEVAAQLIQNPYFLRRLPENPDFIEQLTLSIAKNPEASSALHGPQGKSGPMGPPRTGWRSWATRTTGTAGPPGGARTKR